MKAHGNMCIQHSPCEQAQAKNTSRRQRRVGKQPLFILNQKEQLGTQYKGTKPLRMDKGLSHKFFATLCLP